VSAHIDRRQRLGDFCEGHRPDAAGNGGVKTGHVLVASDSVPQGFERRVDNLPAAVIVHVGNYRLIQPWQSAQQRG
jgi:hypothetical protein